MIKEEFDLSEKLWYHLARRIVKAEASHQYH